jgi:hypothetical protein
MIEEEQYYKKLKDLIDDDPTEEWEDSKDGM